jgi:hypothetical protein
MVGRARLREAAEKPLLASEWQFGLMWKSGPFRAVLRLQEEGASALVVAFAGNFHRG